MSDLNETPITIDAVVFDELVRSAGFAADAAALDAIIEKVTPAQVTARAVEAAFAHAVGLGLVTVTPLDDWPEMQRLEWSRSDVVRGASNETG